MKGFTLVEILVAIVVMAILGIIGFVNYRIFSATQVLNSSASDVQNLLRQAQSNATASVKCSGSGSFEWLIIFTNSTNIDLKCKTSATSQETPVKSLTLPAKVTTSAIYGAPNCIWSFPATISFATLSGKVDFPGASSCTSFIIPLVYSSQDINLTKTITVTRGGAIEEGSPGPIPVSTPTPTPTAIPTPTPAPIYVDNDLDGYGAGAAVSPCPAGKTCVTNNSDCYDSNTNAKPGQTNFFTTNRGDGSFDYDCNGTEDGQAVGWVTKSAGTYKDSACTQDATWNEPFSAGEGVCGGECTRSGYPVYGCCLSAAPGTVYRFSPTCSTAGSINACTNIGSNIQACR